MGSTANGKREGEKEKLPLAPDLDQIFNRISMGLNHHSLLSRSLKKPTTTSSTSTPSTSSTPGPNPETTTKKGFSSLANAASSTFSSTKQLSTSLNDQRRSEKTSAARLADLDALFAEPPNAGLGYFPPSKSGPNSGSSTPSLTGDREKDRRLRAQILGGRAKHDEQTGNNRNLKRGGKGPESDSDEDVGRSALGRPKKKVRLGTGVAESAGVAASVAAVAQKRGKEQKPAAEQTEMVDKNNNIGKIEEEDGAASTSTAPVPAEQEEKADNATPKETTVAQQISEVGGEGAGGEEEAKEKKKKKKKKSKNRNKKKKKSEEGAPDLKEGGGQDQDGEEDED